MSGLDYSISSLRITCDACGESWWLEYDTPACVCADGGQWQPADRARRGARAAESGVTSSE